MATSTTAQDVMRCDLCETNIVQMHCDTCLVNLCKVCVGEHFSKDLSKAHKIVDFKDRKSTLIFPQCANHSDSLCESFCNDCNTPLCMRCVISSDTHKEHQLSIISDIYDSKKQVIQKEFKELQELIAPSYQNIASNLQFRIKQLESIYEYTTTVITKHGEEWHEEIEKYVNELKTSVKEMKNKHVNTLKEHQDDILKKIEKIHDAEQQCQNLEASNDISQTLNYTSLNEEYKNLPPKPVGSFPVFTPIQVKDATSKFRDLFGNLTNLSFVSEKHGYCMKAVSTSPEAGSSPQVKQHLYQPIKTDSNLPSWISKNTGTCSFISSDNNGKEIWETINNDIKLFSRSHASLIRSVTATLSVKSFSDMAVMSCGDLAYINYDNRTINIVQNDKTEVVMLENWRPHRICSTSSDDFLVILVSDDRAQTKLVRYSGSTEKQTIQYDDEGNPLYSSGKCKYISENRNLDICVADYGAGAVVVVNQAGKLRFRYNGHTPGPKNKPFSPKGITTDSQSYILTSDYNNDCIHVLDQDGQFLRYIDCQFSYHPEGLCTDTSDNLFVLLTEKRFFIFNCNNLDIYKYLM